MRDKKSILAELIKSYQHKHKKSAEVFATASRSLVKGGSHNLRLFSPFPFYDIRSGGSKVTDIDGNTYVDFWQGHFANILGHNPPVVLDALKEYMSFGQGLITGFPGEFQYKLAQLILDRISADKIRFTTSGTLASMYAIMLSKAFTKRDTVVKVGGGWHGAQPYVLKGITTYKDGLNQIESAGLSKGIDSTIVITKFNDEEHLEKTFKIHGEKIACFIIEPFIGAGGFLFGHAEYLNKARELTSRYGSLLIFDEVISGFRFHAGGLQSLYGIEPDLTVFGKAIGGGMPVSAVAGREDILALFDPEANPLNQVKFEGGTFSAHPASMLAGLTFLEYLIQNEKDIYSKIGSLGERVRSGIEEIFNHYEIHVKCTGGDGPFGIQSSLIGVNFLNEKLEKLSFPEQIWNPKTSNIELREKIFKLAMLEEGYNTFHGYGAISTAHSDEEIQGSLDAVERIAKKWSK
ncbi:MAG: aminotransferase class III-fold pyridoxal phosphate-dependent enzyme [Candidatus Aminicenantes bacterium]|nr:aminotransferase class III-fold pyridoxal phosphate-dependent enzyme [Candidatus Aminicenantes bacterium]